MSKAPPSASSPDPSLTFEHLRARVRFGVSQHSGSLQDLGPGLSFTGLTPNDASLAVSGYVGRYVGGWLSLNREVLSLYRNGQLSHRQPLRRASIGPSARFPLRQLRLEIGGGYQFAELPNFTASQSGQLGVARRHAVFVGMRGRVPIGRRTSLEVNGELPVALAAKDVHGSNATSYGATMGLGMHFMLARTNRIGWGLAADYQWVNDALTSASGARNTQTIHRFGLSLDVTLLDRIPVLGRVEQPARPLLPKGPALRVAVTHMLTGAPVPNASVIAGTREVKTDAEGFAQIDGLARGPVTVHVQADGFRARREVASLVEDIDTEFSVDILPMLAPMPAKVSGWVRARPLGAPLKARLRVLNTDMNAETDAEGAFKLQLDPGTYRVIISAPGYRSQRKTVKLLEGEKTIFNVDLHPKKP